jgi:hypothetical protein
LKQQAGTAVPAGLTFQGHSQRHQMVGALALETRICGASAIQLGMPPPVVKSSGMDKVGFKIEAMRARKRT